MVIGGATIENLLAKLVFTPGVKRFIPIDLINLNLPYTKAEVSIGRSASTRRAPDHEVLRAPMFDTGG